MLDAEEDVTDVTDVEEEEEEEEDDEDRLWLCPISCKPNCPDCENLLLSSPFPGCCLYAVEVVVEAVKRSDKTFDISYGSDAVDLEMEDEEDEEDEGCE